jgi:nucleotide-binding universal stress UspA family protein
METIVVGVDGSQGARAALEYATREAALRRAQLRVVYAWQISPVVYSSGYAPVLDEGFNEAAETLAREAIAAVKELDGTIECEGEAVEGQPALVLLREARDADLIVVGNRGMQGGRRVLGSVPNSVSHHAPCSVLIVDTQHEHGDGD